MEEDDTTEANGGGISIATSQNGEAANSTAPAASNVDEVTAHDANNTAGDGAMRDSIRSRTSGMLNNDIIVTAPVQNVQRQSAAAEFEQRLKRDQRFRKETSCGTNGDFTLIEADKENSQSPVKNPERPVRG